MTAGLRLVDTHAHLMDRRFDDLDAVLARAEQAGVARMVMVGYDVPGSRAAVDLARRYPSSMRATVGIHPNSAGRYAVADYDAIARLAREPEVVGVGETGLDNYRERTPPARQRESLRWHAELAEALHLPLIIHNRDADADVIGELESFAARRPGELPGLLHCFSSTDPRFLERAVAAGYFVSFAGPVTFRNAGGLLAQVPRVPLDRLLIETDCPYLAPEPVRGRRNEPAFVRHTAARLAEILGIPLERLADQLWANSLALFPALAPTPLEKVAS